MSLQSVKKRGHFIVSEANGTRSRGKVNIAATQTLVSGSVLGKVTSSGELVEFDPSEADGSEVVAGIAYEAVESSATVTESTVILRDAEVNGGELVFNAVVTPAEITTAYESLKTLGIYVL